jgi:PAS domain S-box-containing protein
MNSANTETPTQFSELKATGALPSPSGVALALLELSRKEDVSTQEVVDIIQTDPALAGRLLELANAPTVGLSRPVASLHDAVVILGFSVIRALALGLSVLSNTLHGACENFDYPHFWSRSLVTALAAQALSGRDKSFPPGEVFSYGLLSEIGRLALASLYPESYGKILLSAAHEGDEVLLALEHKHLSTDHVELSVALLEDWGLPEIGIEAVRHHHQHDDAEHGENKRLRDLVHLLRIASYLGNMFVSDKETNVLLMPELISLCEAHGLPQEELEQLFEVLKQQWQEWGRLLEVPTHPVPVLSDLLEDLQRDQQKNKKTLPVTRMRILLVDDDPVVLHMLTKQLEDAGHQVFTAENGKAALQLALEAKPNIVITDWMMPEMDGIALCKALRETRLGQLLYIIMLTQREDEDWIVQAFEAGADDYVTKPFNPKVLQARLRAGVRQIRLQAAVKREHTKNRKYLAQLSVSARRLQEERNRAQRYLDTAEVVLLALDRSANITLINRKGCQVVGYSEDELLGENWFDRFTEESGREELRRDFLEVMEGKEELTEYFETSVRTREGKERIIAWHNSLLRSAGGDVMGILSSGEDITDFRQSMQERMQLQRQLMQAQKMEAIGQLTGGIAHDFNNILAAMLGYCELVQAKVAPLDDEPLNRYLAEIQKSGRRAKGLVGNMMAFTRGDSGEERPLNIAEVVKDTLGMLRSLIPSSIQIDTELVEDLSLVLMNEIALQQVLMNLCINARDAIDGNGAIVITVRSIKVTSGECVSCHQRLSGDFVELSVTDNGHGIQTDNIANIFQPFFSTKEVGKGTGMGLAVVHGIVHGYEGHILVDTKESGGTCFRLLFEPIRPA